MKKVLIVGGAGYVGTELTSQLLSEGYQVRVLDTFWYWREPTRFILHENLESIPGDIRDIEIVKKALKGVHYVVHLACISNDPSFDLDPRLGKSVNFDSFEPFLRICLDSGVERFVFASSSSVYGVSDEEQVTEEIGLNPITDYSKYKVLCERILLDNINEDCAITILRPATVCGPSRRQRIDLVVNILSYDAFFNNLMTVHGGEQFRPNIDISDMVQCYSQVLRADKGIINGKIYNVGGENYTLSKIALIIQENIGVESRIIFENVRDQRSYRINSALINKEIGFRTKVEISESVKKLGSHFASQTLEYWTPRSKFTNIDLMMSLGLN